MPFTMASRTASLPSAQKLKRSQTGLSTSTQFQHDDLRKKVLHRVEFQAALIHIAINRYVVTVSPCHPERWPWPATLT